MRHLFTIFAVVCLIATAAFAQSVTPVTMKVGTRQLLQVAGKTGDGLTMWTSSHPDIAEVINTSDPKLNGTVVARKAGMTTITATVKGDTTTVPVTVTANGP